MKKILLFLASLLIFSAIDNSWPTIFTGSSVYCAESWKTVPTSSSLPTKSPVTIEKPTLDHPSKTDNSIFIVVAQIIASIIGGGLAGAVVNICATRRQSKKELQSLILAFASEFIFAFARCVNYYEQSKKREISFSGLFDFTDASILSRFAVVNTKPDVVTAIMDLKAHYFQIRRHVEDAGKFAVQAKRLAEDEKDMEKLMGAAGHAQATALAFFFSSYEDIVQKTSTILEEAKKISPVKVVDDLEQKFKDATAKKSKLDETDKKSS